MEEFKDEYRCIVTDLRNAHGGQSTGPLEVDRPWDSYTDDLIGLIPGGHPNSSTCGHPKFPHPERF